MKAANLLASFTAARQRSVPLISITTPDPGATIALLAGKHLDESDEIPDEKKAPILRWNIIEGVVPVNKPGKIAYQQLIADIDPSMLVSPYDSLNICARLPERSILFYQSAHRFIESESVAQAAWNLRDRYKADRRTLVFLSPGITFPAELTNDVLVLDEPLPDDEQLGGIIDGIYTDSGVEAPGPEVRDKTIDAVRGLAAFTAEQAAAMSLSASGIDVDALWNRKRDLIEATPGLSVWRGGEKFSDIGGVENVKRFMRCVLDGRSAPRAVVFIDEIEKALAGSSGSDSSGVSQSMLGTLLQYMQDNRATGSIFIGPPGAAKSLVAKATGSEGGIPTIALDLSGMKASLVGESEARLRQALKIITAVSGGRSLWIATCNQIESLKIELRRRFTFGTFFFDLPSKAERDAIWSLYIGQFELDPQSQRPADEGWTGAEIRQCVDIAWRLRIPLTEAAGFIVPVSQSAPQEILRLRKQASGRFISASHPGAYEFDQSVGPAPTGRLIDVE